MTAPRTEEQVVHTPGPWHIAEREATDTIEIYTPRPVGRFIIAEVPFGFTAEIDEEQRANAELMRLAPELLAVVKEAARECAECGGDGQALVTFNDGVPEYTECPGCGHLRKLISRVSGKE